MQTFAGSVCRNDQMNLQISHITGIKGELFVALHNSGDTYLSKKSKPFRSATVKVKQQGSQQVSLCDVKEGQYAVSIFQDENGNGKLDSNFIGIPKEPYGFSNNLRKMLPPSFEEASFHYAGEELIEINLK
jgi:uncharacterized protein (DUF2141 family)